MFKLFFHFVLTFIFCSFLWIILDSFYHYFITPKVLNEPVIYKEYGFLHKLFIQLPRQLGIDRARFDRNVFNAHGLIIFTGRQGFGKTISMIRYANKLKAAYPECIVVSNTDTIFTDVELFGWRPLLDIKNGSRGVVVLLDEISVWFSSRFYSNFPYQMISILSQNRKNRRVILGTAQNFSMCDKQIRIQATYQVKCYCLLNCIVLNFWSVPEFDNEGNLVKSRFKRFDWFVQDDFLRECYDTYSVIDSLSKTGFMERGLNNDL